MIDAGNLMEKMALKPTEKQLNYANVIAKSLGKDIPRTALENRKACSEFISTYQKSFLDKGSNSLIYSQPNSVQLEKSTIVENRSEKKVLQYWYDGLIRTAFEGLGILPSQIESYQSFSFEKIDYVLNNFCCKELSPTQDSVTVRHLVLRLAVKSQSSSRFSQAKPIVIAVFPLSINFNVPENKDHNRKHTLPYSWQRAPDELPLFNQRILGENAEIEGLMLNSPEALDELLNASLEDNNVFPAQADLTKCLEFFDLCFNALTGREDGCAGWIECFEQQQHDYPNLRNRIVEFVLVDGNAAAGATRQVRDCYQNIIQDTHLLLDEKLNLFRRLINGYLPSDSDSSEPFYQSLEVLNLEKLTRYLGHMDSAKTYDSRECYPLDDSQRVAMSLFTQVKNGNLLAVNGPPGTGKTSLMRAVIADAWIAPLLLDEQEPNAPVLLACAATNQAVTNVISSFDKVPGQMLFDDNAERISSILPSIESRWIPHLISYGWYVPASIDPKKESEHAGFQVITRQYPNKPWKFYYAAENFGNLSLNIKSVESAFLSVVKEYFNYDISLNQAADSLRLKVTSCVKKVEKLSEALKNWIGELSELQTSPWSEARECARNNLLKHSLIWEGEHGQCISIENEINCIKEQIVILNDSIKKLTDFLKNSLLNFFKRVLAHVFGDKNENDQWEVLRNTLSQLGVSLPGGTPVLSLWIDAIHSRIQILQKQLSERYFDKQKLLAEYESCQKDLLPLNEMREKHFSTLQKTKKYEQELIDHIKKLSNGDVEEIIKKISYGMQFIRLEDNDIDTFYNPLVMLIQRWLDINIRPQLFHITARYWEARYIIYQKEVLKFQKNHPNYVPTSEERLRELAMLAPVFVVTTYSAPKLMKRVTYNQRDSHIHYLYGFADLLIVDEAGQATPEIGACAFAYAKRAIVVGDLKQLSPVWNVPLPVDRLMLEKHALFDLVQDNNDTSPLYKLQQRGLLLSSGSIMLMAQHATKFYNPNVDMRGAILTHHYRCRFPIIHICNTMVYNGILKVVMPATEPKREWHNPLGFLVVDGESTKLPGGSRCNYGEAELIARWVKEKRQSILEHYNSDHLDIDTKLDLPDLLAILTPFKGQVPILRKALAQALGENHLDKNAISNQMVIGTVHSLQGAERKIVIFSMVDSKDPASDHFYDENTSLVNVAISRAKEVFIVTLDQNAVNYARTLSENKLNKPSDYVWYYVVKNGTRLNSRNVLLIESPNKRHHIEEALQQGMELEIVATNGHLTQLYSGNNWNPLSANEPRWENLSEKEIALYQRIATLWQDLNALYVATDSDAEGECIAWHFINRVKEHLQINLISRKNKHTNKIKRMRFYSLVGKEIYAAYKNASSGLDVGLIKSALVRSFLDQIIARHYPHKLALGQINEFSPGIGRVQLAILDIVNRANKIKEKYVIEITVPLNNSQTISKFILSDDALLPIEFDCKIDAEKKTAEINQLLSCKTNTKLSWKSKLEQLPEYPAINTANFLALAYRMHNIQPQRVMSVLQALYEGQTETNDKVLET
jgi:hypothetical protein